MKTFRYLLIGLITFSLMFTSISPVCAYFPEDPKITDSVEDLENKEGGENGKTNPIIEFMAEFTGIEEAEFSGLSHACSQVPGQVSSVVGPID